MDFAYKKVFMHVPVSRLAAILSAFLISTLVEANTDAPVPGQSNGSVSETHDADWQLSLIAGGFSTHLTTKYEPEEGYTEQHSNLGVEIGQAGPGWVASAQATWFNDSHGEDSFMGLGAFGYRKFLPYRFFIYGGIGAGYVETSYYSGAVAMPFGELGWWRISMQGSYLPELSNMDSGIAVQFKFRVLSW